MGAAASSAVILRGLEFLRFAASSLAKRFDVVRAVRDSPPEDAGATNVVFFASDDAVDWPAPAERPEVGSQEWVAAHVAAANGNGTSDPSTYVDQTPAT